MPRREAQLPPRASTASRARSRRWSATACSCARSRRPSASTSRSRPSSAPTTRRPRTRPASPANCCCSSLRRVWTTSATASALRCRRRQARQVVRHGHIQVNGRKVNIPSFQCKVGDEIADPRRLEGSWSCWKRRRTSPAASVGAVARHQPRQSVRQDHRPAQARGRQPAGQRAADRRTLLASKGFQPLAGF
jgi:hypothetical protein